MRIKHCWKKSVLSHQLFYDPTDNVKLDSVCMGKPVTQVSEDIEEGRNIMNYFAGLVELTHGETSLNTPNHLNMMVRQPFGIVAAIVPWNFPTMLVSGHLAHNRV